VLAKHGLSQLRCAESEKHPHVTYFFNDYKAECYLKEMQLDIPSPKHVATYDALPAMSAVGVTDAVVNAIKSELFDFILVNFANGDMVGHTGNLEAAIKAVETVDAGVGRIVDAVLARGGALVVTADHGNCEQMIDPETGGPHTKHTTYKVDLIVVDDDLRQSKLLDDGRLADVAPTLLQLLGLPQPTEMTGRSLVVK
jgi:2,3-bisphosphoglycerate-independent phosphoglycerate mutase